MDENDVTAPVAEEDVRVLRQAQDEARPAQDEVAALNARVEAFEGRDWDGLFEADPQAAQAEWIAYMRARDSRDRLVGTLQAQARREHARRLQQAQAEVARDIKDWSPELARRLTEFGRSMGFSDEELGAITDARQVKILHAAWRDQQRAAAERLPAAQGYAPVTTLSGAAGRIETAADTDDFLAFERLAASRKR